MGRGMVHGAALTCAGCLEPLFVGGSKVGQRFQSGGDRSAAVLAWGDIRSFSNVMAYHALPSLHMTQAFEPSSVTEIHAVPCLASRKHLHGARHPH